VKRDISRGYQQRLLKELAAKGCFSTPWLAEAVKQVPRQLFIGQYYATADAEPSGVNQLDPSEDQLRIIYSDTGLMIRQAPNHSAASQPSLVLSMLAALDVHPGQKILEVGTGTGWNAGLLSVGTGDDRLVYSIDMQPDLVDAARICLLATVAMAGRQQLHSIG